MKKTAWFALVLFFALPASLHAYPSVSSFTASPERVNYGYQTVLSWTLNDSAGHYLLFTCPSGVTIERYGAGSFPCGVRKAVSSNASDSAVFSFINATGVDKTVTARLYPVDGSGVQYDGYSTSVSIVAGAIPQPITDVSVSTVMATSGSPVVVTWTGVGIGGANIQFDCAAGITLTSATPSVAGNLPCGNPAYATDLPASGSITVTPVNSTGAAVSVAARMLPAASPGVYDGTHAKPLGFVVGPSTALAPSTSTFIASPSVVQTGATTTLSWKTEGTAGVNFIFPCVYGFTAVHIGTTATTTVGCGVLLFASPQASEGSATFTVGNSASGPIYPSVSLVPYVGGSYDATKGKSLVLTVVHSGGNLVSPTPAVPAPAPGAIAVVRTTSFSTYLFRGSRGAQVTALQRLLSQDKALYPEGLATGLFGPATERAVQRFQERYGLASKGVVGYGTVGPKTRAKLNSLVTF